MTVQTTFNKQEYTGNGVTTTFDFSFPFFVKDDIIVTQIDTSGVEKELAIGANYSISGVPFQWWNNGSSIVLNYPLPNQYRLIVERIVSPTQETSLRNLGRYDASAIEKEFDKLTMICQQITGNYGDFLSKNKSGTKWITEGLPFDYVSSQSGAFTNLSSNIAQISLLHANLGSNLNANGLRVLNLPPPSDLREPLRKGDAIEQGAGPSFQYVDEKILTDLFSAIGYVFLGLWTENEDVPAKEGRVNGYAKWLASEGKIIVPIIDGSFNTGSQFDSSQWRVLTFDSKTINPSEFGVVAGLNANPVTNAAALVRACAAGDHIHFDNGQYFFKFDNSQNNSLVEFTNRDNIQITGKGAYIHDDNTYTVDKLVNVFKFKNCKNIYIDVNGSANELADITAPYPLGIGYAGAAFVYIEGSCNGFKMDSFVDNYRYAVRQGGYSDPSLGGAKDLDIKLNCSRVGYPVAFYNASDIKLDITSDIQHRAAYITGCRNVTGNIQFTGFTYAAIGVLIADAIQVASVVDDDRRAFGGKNIKLNVTDTGSTGTQSNRSATGMTRAWKAPETRFEDIHINLCLTTSNANRTIAGFRLENTVGWYPTDRYSNIKVSGTIDRRLQTEGGSQWADISIDGIEPGDTSPYNNSPKFNNIDLDDLIIIRGSVTGNSSRVWVPNLFGTLKMRNMQADGATFSIIRESGVADLTNSIFGSIAGDATYPTVKKDQSGYRVNSDGTIDQWMLVNYTVTADTDQTFDFPIPFPNEAWSPCIEINGITGRTWSVNGVSKTGITIRCSVTSVSFYIRIVGC